MLIAIAFVVLVLGILSYLFYFKPKQEQKRMEAQKENIENLYKDAFGDLIPHEKPLDELTQEERKLKETEQAYQGCFDKAEKLNEPIGDRITNKYRIECGEDGINNWDRNWEFRFVDWLNEKHPDFCKEFDIEKINTFLNKKREEFGHNFDSFND